MTDGEIGDLLARWARYVVLGNRSRLGYAMASYTGLVGSPYTVGDDAPPCADFEVLKCDDAIKRAPPSLREILWLHYIVPGSAKSKHGKQHQQYYARLKLAKACLVEMLAVEEVA